MESTVNPPNLDVALSTRASESTLSSVDSKLGDLRGALGSVATDTLRVDDAGGSLTIDNTNIDTYLPNLHTALSTRASESTLSGIKTQTDKLTFDANSFLRMALASDEIGLAKESTLSSELTRLAKLRIYDDTLATPDWTDLTRTILRESKIIGDDVGLLKTADLSFDASGYLNVNVQVTANPSNLDVALSTRASESTLSAVDSKLGDIRGALASVASDKLRTSIIDSLPSGDNWIGRVKIGDGTNVLSLQTGGFKTPVLEVMAYHQSIPDYKEGAGASLEALDDVVWKDTTTYTVTETTWTSKTNVTLTFRRLPVDMLLGVIVVKGYVSATGETMYVRIVDAAGNVLDNATITATTETTVWLWFTKHSATHWDRIYVQAYVGKTSRCVYVIYPV